MKRLRVEKGPVRIPAGSQVKLTAEQAAARIGSLTALSGGVYRTEALTEWKTGEVLETDADFGKGLAGWVEDAEPAPEPPVEASAPRPAKSSHKR